MAQKQPAADEELDIHPLDISPLEYEDEETPSGGGLTDWIPESVKSGWEWANTPVTDAPSRFARSVADVAGLDPEGWTRWGVEGAGNVASSLTSPLNAAMTAATMGSGPIARAGFGLAGKGLSLLGRGLSAGVAGEGAYNMYEQPTLAGKTAGALELLGGGLGMRHSLNLAPRATAARTAAEDIRTTRATPHLDAVIASRNKVFSDAGILPQDIARFTDEDSDVIYQYLLGHPVKGANEAMAKYGIPPLEKFPPSNLSKGGIELETTNPAHMEALKGTIDDSLESRFNAMMESKGATTKAVGKSGIKDIELDIKPIQKSASPEFDPTSLQGLKPAETSGARPVNIGIAPSKIKVAKQIITDYDTRIDLAKMSDEQIIDMAESIDPTRTTASAPVPKTKAGGKPPKPPSTKGDMLFSEELPPDANIQARKQPA